MRLIAIILTACITASAADGVSQKITLDLKNVPVQKVFREIIKQSGISIIYDAKQFEGVKPVTIKVDNMPVEYVVEKCLAGLGFDYVMESGAIIIKKEVMPVPARHLSAPLISPSLTSPPIRGKVLDEDGQPLVGASVTIKKSSTSAITDAQGYFSLNVNEGDILVVTYIGYQAKEITVTSGMLSPDNTFIITLSKANTQLDTAEVIVKGSNGYQVIDKNHPGSFDVVSEELLNRRVGFNIIDRIRDLTPGVSFDNSGDGLLIRGRNSIYSNVSPLIVVDNFQYDGKIENINPNDIESITILKDAASTALWGARAGNGVIVITTKRGKTSKPSISFNTNGTFQRKQNLDNYDVISSKDAVDVEKYLYENGYYNTAISMPNSYMISPVVQTLEDLKNNNISQEESDALLEKYRNTSFKDDLKKYFYRNSFSQQHSISVSGNTPFVNYHLSGGYDQGQSQLVGANNNRITLKNKNTFKISQAFQVEAGMTYVRNNSTSGSNSDINTFFIGDKKLYPYANLVDDNGIPLRIVNTYSFPYIDTAGGGKLLDWNYLPYKEISNTTSKVKTTDFLVNIVTRLRILPYLVFDLKYQFQNQLINNSKEFGPTSFYARDLINSYYQPNSEVHFPIPMGGVTDIDNSEVMSHQGRAQLSFSKTFNRLHDINVITGFEIRDMKTSSNSNRQYGVRERGAGVAANIDYQNEYSIYPGINVAATIPNNQGKYNYLNRFVSSYINALYRFNNKYSLSASAREDAANLFGVATNQKGVPLWSVGAGWTLSNEKFYNLKGIPNLRLRATYGLNGNFSTQTAAESIITYQNHSSGITFAQVENPPNDKLRWEQVRILNVGVDFETFNGRLSGSIEYFRKDIHDLLAQAPVDPTLFSSPFGESQPSYYYANIARVRGKGLEVSINSRIIDQSFKWDNSFLFSYALNKIADYYLPAPTTAIYYVNANFSTLVGKPVYSLHSLRWAGLEKETGDPLGYIGDKPSKDYQAIINSKQIDSIIYNGPTQPPYFGSMRNTFEYKSVSISVLFNYRFGGYFRRPNVLLYENLYRSWSGAKEYEKRWQKPGDELVTNVPSQVYTNYAQFSNRDVFYLYNSVNVDKSDFIRLSDVSISYNLKNIKFIKKGFSDFKIYAYIGNINVLLWKANKFNLDPMFPVGEKPSATISIGLNAHF